MNGGKEILFIHRSSQTWEKSLKKNWLFECEVFFSNNNAGIFRFLLFCLSHISIFLCTAGKHLDSGNRKNLINSDMNSRENTFYTNRTGHFFFFFNIFFYSLNQKKCSEKCSPHLVCPLFPCGGGRGHWLWTGTVWSCPPRWRCICSGSQTESRVRGSPTPARAVSTSHYLHRHTQIR